MNLEIIRKLCEKRTGGIRKLSEDIGMTEANLHRCIRLNKIQAQDLEAIANELNVSIVVFFDEDTHLSPSTVKADNGSIAFAGNISGNVNSDQEQVNALKQLVEQMKSQLEDKDKIIKLLER
jgi:DNA-binding Xre family transcriptional regulator